MDLLPNDMERAEGNGMLPHIRKFPVTISLKRLGLFAVGIGVGLGLAVGAYQSVALIGVALSSAESVGELRVGWFPIRVLVAYGVARLGAGGVYRLGLKR